MGVNSENVSHYTGFTICKVGSELPRSGPWPSRKLSEIKRVYVHHSGANGRPGIAGLEASARYSVDKLRWKATPYHYWIPYEPVFDGAGRMVVYQCNPLSARSWHTGGVANSHGVSVCLQGNLTNYGPTHSQWQALTTLHTWLCVELGLEFGEIWGHSESGQFGGSGKSSCPGPLATACVREMRREARDWTKRLRFADDESRVRELFE